jgi:3-dehydroquinate synthase
VRKVLNFGHTIGHGIEAHSWESPQRMLLHGEAVAIGMVCEAWLSWRMDLLTREDYDRITEQLLALYKPYQFDSADNHRLIELMRNDKKNSAGQFRFTLLTGIGQAKVDVHVTAAQVQEALEHYRLLVMIDRAEDEIRTRIGNPSIRIRSVVQLAAARHPTSDQNAASRISRSL